MLTFNKFHSRIIRDLGCYEDRHVATMAACEVARRARVQLVERLTCEAMKEGGEIVEIDGLKMARADYIKSLQDLITWTYEICKLAGEELGPAIAHVAVNRNGGCHERDLW